MNWKIFDEAVEMLERRHGFFPRAFRWRGQRFEVEAVQRCWTTSGSGWLRSTQRHFFHVRCGESAFELFQDLRDGTWHLRRARLAAAPRAAVRRVAPAWR